MARKTVEERIDEAAQKKLSALLTIVDESFIVRVDKNAKAIFIGGERADDVRLSNLKAEAQFLSESELWKLLNQTPRELAQQAMFISGDDIDAMKKGRSILYTLSVQKNILDTFMSYGGKKTT